MGRREKIPAIPWDGEVPLGAKIRARRWHQGMTLSHLARVAGNYDESHLSHIENGRDIPSPDLLEAIALALGITVAGLKDATADEVQSWLDHRLRITGVSPRPAPAVSETAGGSHRPAAAAMHAGPERLTLAVSEPVAPPALFVEVAPLANGDAPLAHGAAMFNGPAASDDAPAPLAPTLLATIAPVLGTTVEELESVPADTVLAWLDRPERYHASRSGLTQDSPVAPQGVALSVGKTAPPVTDAMDAADDPAPGSAAGEIPLELLTAVAEAIGTTPNALYGASELQLIAWLQDPDAFPGPRTVPPPVVPAPVDEAPSGQDSTPGGTGAVKAVLPDDPSAFRDEYQLTRKTTSERFRQLRELAARERLADRPDVLAPLLQRMWEIEQYQDAVKAQGMPSAGYGMPPQGSGPRRSPSASSTSATLPRTAALFSGDRDRDRDRGKTAVASRRGTSIFSAVGAWLGGLFGGVAPARDGKHRR